MPRKKYTKEFKIQVVKQVIEEGKKITEIAKELELPRDMVYRWITEYEANGDEAFSGHGNARINSEFEIKKLKNQIESIQKECEILKKYSTFLKEQNSKSFNL
ncbi:transposase [Romboutsia lituseburensis]|uniref:transposase n=1 Tax=Romboutsia lituseburensis TaxID=1537 RepID=UPI00215ACC92|nr:transposase [Romboutsia lituseburensis]MCR8746025.1 transposase [Romboutsia lituseburensis]